MGKKNNVNKDRYEHSHGRERQGEEIVQSQQRERLREDQRRVRREFQDQRKEGRQSPAPPDKV